MMNHVSCLPSCRLAILALALGWAMPLVPAPAQTPGSVDPTFNVGAGVTNEYEGVNTLAIQGDGKILFVGTFTEFNYVDINDVVRLNPDGSIDSGFDVGTGAEIGDSAVGVEQVAVQSDGKILLAGDFTAFNGVALNRIARLNPDGSVDPTFQSGMGPSDYVNAITTQSDGRILVSGQFISFNGMAASHVVRLNSDGSMDPSFTSGLGASDIVEYSTVQSDGKILVAGTFTPAAGSEKYDFIRLNADGSVDTSFALSVHNNGDNGVVAAGLQSDGRIVVSILNDLSSPESPSGRLYRLNTDGTIDTSFTTFDTAVPVFALAVQADDKIVVGGYFYPALGGPFNGIARLNADGSLDTSFNPGTAGSTPDVYAMALQSDGKIVALGGFGRFNGVLEAEAVRLYGGNGGPDTVSLAVKRNGEAEEGGANGIAVVSRAGGTDEPLTVFYQVKGSAVAGVDYEALPGTVVIPAGSARAKIKIKPIDGSPNVGTRKVKLVLLTPDGGSYSVGVSRAKIKIVGE